MNSIAGLDVQHMYDISYSSEDLNRADPIFLPCTSIMFQVNGQYGVCLWVNYI